MVKIPELSDLFLAAADIEAETPITIGVNKVGPDGYFTNLQPVRSWDAWASSFPLKEMKRLRFSLPSGSSAAEVVLGFFGVPSPEGWQEAWQASPMALRQTRVFDARKEAVAAWVRQAEIVASRIQLADYDEAKLRSSLDELRRLTRERVEVGLDKAQQLCSRVGVALVMVPELPGTRLSGCARWLNDRHAMVSLTTRYKKDDQLWFTFFHELGHILLHRGLLSLVVDNAAEYMGDAVIDTDMANYEQEADRFASDTLIPPAALADFLRLHGKALTNDAIHDFAEAIGVGPGLVVGRLQHDSNLKWTQGNALKQTVDWGFPPEE